MATRVANVELIASYFESLSDPRHTRNRKHRLIDIVVIAVCGLVCGCDGPTAVVCGGARSGVAGLGRRIAAVRHVRGATPGPVGVRFGGRYHP